MCERLLLSCSTLLVAGALWAGEPASAGPAAPAVVADVQAAAAWSQDPLRTVVLDAVGDPPRDPRVLRRADLDVLPRRGGPLVALEVDPITGEVSVIDQPELAGRRGTATKDLIDSSFVLNGGVTCTGCGQGCRIRPGCGR